MHLRTSCLALWLLLSLGDVALAAPTTNTDFTGSLSEASSSSSVHLLRRALSSRTQLAIQLSVVLGFTFLFVIMASLLWMYYTRREFVPAGDRGVGSRDIDRNNGEDEREKGPVNAVGEAQVTEQRPYGGSAAPSALASHGLATEAQRREHERTSSYTSNYSLPSPQQQQTQEQYTRNAQYTNVYTRQKHPSHSRQGSYGNIPYQHPQGEPVSSVEPPPQSAGREAPIASGEDSSSGGGVVVAPIPIRSETGTTAWTSNTAYYTPPVIPTPKAQQLHDESDYLASGDAKRQI